MTDTLQIATGVEAMHWQPEGNRHRNQMDMYKMMTEMSLTDDMQQHKEEVQQQMEAQQAKMAAIESKLKTTSNNPQNNSSENLESERRVRGQIHLRHRMLD